MTLGLIMLWDDVTPSMTCTPQLPSFEGKRQGCSVLQVDWQYLTVSDSGNMNWQYLLRLWPLELTPHVSCNARVVRRVAQQRVDQSRLTWRCLPLPVVSCCLARNWQGMANIFEYLCKLFEADYKASGSKHNKNLNLGALWNNSEFGPLCGRCRQKLPQHQGWSGQQHVKQSNQHHTEGTAEVLRDVASLSRLILV